MLTGNIDHLVLTAPSLARGVEYVRRTLGVVPQAGGEHPRMGTHNALLRLGPATYLEVLAVNPDAPKPDRPRWFQLDELAPDGGPRLATWVMATNDIHAACSASPFPLGEIERMSRGEFEWLISISPDGILPADGVAPVIIQWLSGRHPAATLEDKGCSLVRLEGFHPQAAEITSLLNSLGFVGEYTVSDTQQADPRRLIATILTPDGDRNLPHPDAAGRNPLE